MVSGHCRYLKSIHLRVGEMAFYICVSSSLPPNSEMMAVEWHPHRFVVWRLHRVGCVERTLIASCTEPIDFIQFTHTLHNNTVCDNIFAISQRSRYCMWYFVLMMRVAILCYERWRLGCWCCTDTIICDECTQICKA